MYEPPPSAQMLSHNSSHFHCSLPSFVRWNVRSVRLAHTHTHTLPLLNSERLVQNYPRVSVTCQRGQSRSVSLFSVTTSLLHAEKEWVFCFNFHTWVFVPFCFYLLDKSIIIIVRVVSTIVRAVFVPFCACVGLQHNTFLSVHNYKNQTDPAYVGKQTKMYRKK